MEYSTLPKTYTEHPKSLFSLTFSPENSKIRFAIVCESYSISFLGFVRRVESRVESGESLDKTREDKGRGNKQTE